MRPRMRSNSSSRELVRGRQLDVEHALLARDERVELVDDLAELARAALLGDQPHEVDDELVGSLGDLREQSSFTRESTSGFSSTARARARPRTRAQLLQLALHCVELALPARASKSARA